MSKEKLICSARAGIRYAGRRVAFWEQFEAHRKDARVLKAIGKAVADPGVAPPIGVDAAPRAVTPVVIQNEPAAGYTPPGAAEAAVETADDLLATPPAAEEQPKISERTGRPVRRYSRRDVQPE